MILIDARNLQIYLFIAIIIIIFAIKLRNGMEEFLINNPFVVGKYLSDKYFCDRENDTEFLRKQIVNGRNVALISPRRIGKSGLIQHFFNQLDIQETYHVFYVDIYATTSLGEFVYTLGKEIYEQLKPQTTAWKEKFFR